MTATYDIRDVADGHNFDATEGVTLEDNQDWFVHQSNKTEIILKHKHSNAKLKIEQRKPTLSDLPFRVYKLIPSDKNNPDEGQVLIDDSDYFSNALQSGIVYTEGVVDGWKNAQNQTTTQ